MVVLGEPVVVVVVLDGTGNVVLVTVEVVDDGVTDVEVVVELVEEVVLVDGGASVVEVVVLW